MKKRLTVVRLDTWYDPAMEMRFGEEPDIELLTCGRSDVAATIGALQRACVYQISSTRSDVPTQLLAGEAILRRCPSILCVSTSGAGHDTVDVAACTAAGVLVVNQAGINARAVAEHTLGVILGLSRRIVESDRRLRRQRGFAREDLMGRDIGGKTLGIVGIGHIGTRVAALAGAFGMEVIACDPYLDDALIAQRGARPVTFDRLLREADFVSLHCPRNSETIGMMDAAAFSRMREGSFFVNTARGGIHDEAALGKALEHGRLAGAAVDVWDTEPPALDHPLLQSDRVIATWHTAGVTHEARRGMASGAADQVVDVLRGRRPPRIVNPQVWDVFRLRLDREVGL
ncbi:MAG TPA: hydroxyacid dehydrogenase [Rhizobiaceae bacterium]